MLRLIAFFSIANLLFSVNIFAETLTLTTPNKFSLKGDYYQGKSATQNSNNRAVLILHQ
jgi:hypothetical protein